MKNVEHKPDQKPAEPYTGGHDSKRAEPGTPGPAPTSKDPSKTYRRPEDEGHRMPESTEPRVDDPGILESERSDRSSGRPLQLEDQPPGKTRPNRPESEPGGSPRQDRPGAGEPLKR